MTTFNDRARPALEQLYNVGRHEEAGGLTDREAAFSQALAALNKAHEEECLRVIGPNFTKDPIKPEPDNWVLHYGVDGYHYTTENKAGFANALLTMQRNRLKPKEENNHV